MNREPFGRGRIRATMRVLGVDARGRAPFWQAGIEDGQVRHLTPVGDLAGALEAPEDVDVIAVDVPLGHEDPQGEGDGLRACDRAARELLGEASDRLFVLPPPAVFDEASYHDALEACRTYGWPKLEVPLWFASERLAALADLAGEDERLVEGHPEVSFAHMGTGEPAPLERYGDSWASLNERLEHLHAEGLHPEGHLEGIEERQPRAALDACAAAWSAHRVAQGTARRLPADPPVDPRTGREVALHA